MSSTVNPTVVEKAMKVDEAKTHGDSIVQKLQGIKKGMRGEK